MKKEMYDIAKAKPKTKTVAQYSLDANLIKEYDSAKKASQELGILSSSIKSCCNQNCATLKGFVFVYPGDFKNDEDMHFEIEKRIKRKKEYDISRSKSKKEPYIPSTNRKKIAHFNLEGELLHIYKSTKETSEALGINMSSIRTCCNETCATLKGQIFLYPEKFDTIEDMKAEALRRSEIWKNYKKKKK